MRSRHFKIRYILVGILLFIVYVIFGVIISYSRQPDVSQSHKNAFHAQDCYSNTVSKDRACVIEDNVKALELRLQMIHQAKKRIVLSTFDFHADESGRDVIAALIGASKRGVKVQILVDGFSAFLHMDRSSYFYALSSEKNVEVKIYNRLNLLMPWKSMGRLHDKYLMVDDNLYLLGGRNTYDYFLGDNGYKNYDRDVLVYTDRPEAGSSIHQLEKYFKSVWNMQECRDFGGFSLFVSSEDTRKAKKELEMRYKGILKEQPQIKKTPDYRAMTFETNKITLLSNPTHVYAKEPYVFYDLIELMKTTEKGIDIHTPYIICNDWMYDSFASVLRTNKNVSLMTNSIANNGNPFGAADYKINKTTLLKTGIQVHEYEGGVSYHGKSIVIGDELAVVGSFNMDMRSAYLDTELMLVIDSREVTKQLSGFMKGYEKKSVEALPDGTYKVPKKVTRQKISKDREWRIKLLMPFDFMRFLM